MMASGVYAEFDATLDQCREVWGIKTNEFSDDVKVGYFDEADITEKDISLLCNLVNGAMLLIGFASPDVDLKSLGALIRCYLPRNVKFFMVSTVGELCSNRCGDALYKPDVAGRRKIVLQSFSRRMASDCQILSMELPNQDLRDGQVLMTMDERIEKMKDALLAQKLNFSINAQDTVALTYVDGISKCEAIVMQAIYESKRYPCVFVGGSAAGNMDLSATYLYDGQAVLQNHVLICLLKMRPGYKFGVFKSQGFEREKVEYTVAEANQSMRYVSKVIDENLQFIDFLDYLKSQFHCDTLMELERVLQDYCFAIEINGDLFARSIMRIDEAERRVYFYCDIGIGEKLLLIKRMSLVDSLQRDWKVFMQGKPLPFAGILTDCMTRRFVNRAHLQEVSIFDGIQVGGLSSFGELLGVPANETLTAVFFFKVTENAAFQDKYHDFFPVLYGEFKSYFLLRRIKQMQIIRTLENKIVEIVQSCHQGTQKGQHYEKADLKKHFADLFDEPFALGMERGEALHRQEVMQAFAGMGAAAFDEKSSADNKDIGTLISYMQMTLNKLFRQREKLEKKVLRMKESMDQYAKDELTETYTRRAGYALIQELMKKKNAAVEFITFAFLDLNNLKRANDLVGHEEGDFYIKTTVGLLYEQISDMDLICRYGGDEFILVFPNETVEYVKSMLLATNRRLGEIERTAQKPYAMSFAFGVLNYHYDSGLAFEDIFRIMDTQMYQYKIKNKPRRKPGTRCEGENSI